MEYYILKSGSSSMILGEGYYSGFFPVKKGFLLKVTEIKERHDEFKYLNYVREIKNYSKYYSIPSEEMTSINPNDGLYKCLEVWFQNEKNFSFNKTLCCVYIDYAGSKDLLDTIGNLSDQDYLSFWKSYKTILNFSKNILNGLSFLHQKKICHLDIKPENIMVDEQKAYLK